MLHIYQLAMSLPDLNRPIIPNRTPLTLKDHYKLRHRHPFIIWVYLPTILSKGCTADPLYGLARGMPGREVASFTG